MGLTRLPGGKDDPRKVRCPPWRAKRRSRMALYRELPGCKRRTWLVASSRMTLMAPLTMSSCRTSALHVMLLMAEAQFRRTTGQSVLARSISAGITPSSASWMWFPWRTRTGLHRRKNPELGCLRKLLHLLSTGFAKVLLRMLEENFGGASYLR